MYQIKERLKNLGKTQMWLVSELRKRGIEVQPPLLERIINGTYATVIAKRILKACNEILTEVENKQNKDKVNK